MLAIVVSSACMMTARITQAVMAPRFATFGVPVSATARLWLDEQPREEVWQAGRVAGVDIRLDAHPAPERRLFVRRPDPHPHRDALDHLHPVAGGVLRRQQREAGGR